MLWFHRLQQRLSLTRNEAITLIVLSTLFIGGLIARHIQQQSNPIAPDAYVESDRIFFERSAQSAAAAADSVGVPDSSVPHAQNGLLEGEGRSASADVVASSFEPATAPAGHVNLNEAGSDELQRLPRVGPKTAERIIAFRELYGPFRDVDDLLQIRGIGPKTLEQIRPMATVGSKLSTND